LKGYRYYSKEIKARDSRGRERRSQIRGKRSSQIRKRPLGEDKEGRKKYLGKKGGKCSLVDFDPRKKGETPESVVGDKGETIQSNPRGKKAGERHSYSTQKEKKGFKIPEEKGRNENVRAERGRGGVRCLCSTRGERGHHLRSEKGARELL